MNTIFGMSDLKVLGLALLRFETSSTACANVHKSATANTTLICPMISTYIVTVSLLDFTTYGTA